MSQGYAVDYYGTTTYGYSQPLDYSVTPFTATQNGYNSLSLAWKSPNSTPWKLMELVSSLYGYPSTPADGNLRLSVANTGSITSFDDTGLLPGRIYYYSIFLSLEAPTWNVGTSYSTNQVVLLNGMYWISLGNSNVGNTPAVGSAFWANTQYVPSWLPAGYTASLVVNSYGYPQHLYDRTPQPYKITASDIFTNAAIDNLALLHYLSIFGFFFDMTRTEYDLYLQGNNPDLISSSNLDWLGKELGITTDYLVAPQTRRNRVKNAASNYRLRGTAQGIHNAIAEVSGWDSTISYSPNLMLSNDQAAFFSPQNLAWSAYEIYFTNQLVQFNGYNYKCLTQAYGNAQAPTGANTANTWWTPQVSTTASPLLDTTTLKNPKNFVTGSGAFSTWESDSFGKLNGVYTGLPHPTNSSINNWNALSIQLAGSPSGNDLKAFGVGSPTSPAWSNSANYVINNYVSTNSGANIWQALKQSGPGTPYGFIAPGTNETFWIPIPVPTLGLPRTLNWFADSIPVHRNTTWNSSTSFTKGTRVVYQGIIYEAIRTNINSAPTGFYTHNSNWIFIQPSDYAYTSSAYLARITTNTSSQTTFSDIVSIDEQLNLSTGSNFAAVPAQANLNYLDRFIANYNDLNGINDNSLSSTGRQWSGTTGLWSSSAGMAFVNQSVALTNTYSILTTNDGRSDLNLALTFVTDYFDTAHYGHGILFRYQDSNNFWYTTRQSLYLVSGGVETLMASWTRLVDGDRMIVGAIGNGITVYKYNRDGTGNTTQLCSITNSTLQTLFVHGLIQKYSPSGAV
jgi:hypothetical protein